MRFGGRHAGTQARRHAGTQGDAGQAGQHAGTLHDDDRRRRGPAGRVRIRGAGQHPGLVHAEGEGAPPQQHPHRVPRPEAHPCRGGPPARGQGQVSDSQDAWATDPRLSSVFNGARSEAAAVLGRGGEGRGPG